MLRVTLRDPKAGDQAAIDAWLPEAVAAVAGRGRETYSAQTLDGFLVGLQPAQRALVVCRRGGEPVGLLVSEPLREAVTVISFLAISAGHRNLGLGAEAVYALEALDERRALIAAVPLANGLALYFWLRTGYRPLFPRTGAAVEYAGDAIWLARGGI